MTRRFRLLYGARLVIVSSSAEMHPQNEYDVSDDEIISNPECHFIYCYCGLKFMSSGILYPHFKNTNESEAALLEQIAKEAENIQ